jgi:hypothetical protein
MQNIHGVFQFDVGDTITYEIVRAGRDITVSTTTDSFSGCNNSGTILENGTLIEVQVTNVETSYLEWNTSNLSPTMEGTCLSLIYKLYYIEFTNEVGYFLADLDLAEIISTGVIAPLYFDPIFIPLFIDPKPDNWISFNNTMYDILIDVNYNMYMGWWDVLSANLEVSDTNNFFSFTLDFVASTVGDPRPDYNKTIESSAFASYNMTSGALVEASVNHTIYGIEEGISYATYSDYMIQQYESPSDGFNFLNFLKENKWYFIGGAGGVGVIALTVGITVGVMKISAKRKGTSKPSSKKKSTKKKLSKKKL